MDSKLIRWIGLALVVAVTSLHIHATENVSVQGMVPQAINGPTNGLTGPNLGAGWVQNAFQAGEVNLPQGNLQVVETDLALPGKAGLDVAIRRSYNSRSWDSSAAISPREMKLWGPGAGKGWTFSFGMRATVFETASANCNKVVIEDNGGMETYNKVSEGQYRSKRPGNTAIVRTAADLSWIELVTNGVVYRFSEKLNDTKLVLSQGQNGVTVKSYGVSTVTDGYGNRIGYTYSEYAAQKDWVNDGVLNSLDARIFAYMKGLPQNDDHFKNTRYDTKEYILHVWLWQAWLLFGDRVCEVTYGRNPDENRRFVAAMVEGGGRNVSGEALSNLVKSVRNSMPYGAISNPHVTIGEISAAAINRKVVYENFVAQNEMMIHGGKGYYDWAKSLELSPNAANKSELYSKRVTGITDTYGRTISIGYNPGGKAGTGWDDMVGEIVYTNSNDKIQRIRYAYNDDQTLKSVTVGEMPPSTYEYGKVERNMSANWADVPDPLVLKKMTSPLGSSVEYEYDYGWVYKDGVYQPKETNVAVVGKTVKDGTVSVGIRFKYPTRTDPSAQGPQTSIVYDGGYTVSYGDDPTAVSKYFTTVTVDNPSEIEDVT
ncbi:hypothetical protein EBR57_07285, partial [bacterium]|nr:hypothetical protein [bacterium]